MTVDEVLAEVEQDASFIGIGRWDHRERRRVACSSRTSPQHYCRGRTARDQHTAIETAGNVPWPFMEKVLHHVDVMLHDHKQTDPERHRKWTGVSNERILTNFKKAYETFPATKFIARTPLIPGVNDDEEHIRAVLAFIRLYANVIDYELLRYHRFGESKYGFLGRVYGLEDFTPPAPETVYRLQAIIDEAFGRSATSAPV